MPDRLGRDSASFCIFLVMFFLDVISKLVLWKHWFQLHVATKAVQPFGLGPGLDGAQAELGALLGLLGTDLGTKGNPITKVCSCESFALPFLLRACWLEGIILLFILASRAQRVLPCGLTSMVVFCLGVPVCSFPTKKQRSPLYPYTDLKTKVVLLTFPLSHEPTNYVFLLYFKFPHFLWAEPSKPDGGEFIGSFLPQRTFRCFWHPETEMRQKKCDPGCVNQCFSPQDELRPLYSDLIGR